MKRETRTAIEALESVLRREISALESGRFDALVQTSTEKEEAGARLEACLAADPGGVGRDRLFALKSLIATDAARLDAARTAAGNAARSIEDARARGGLSGTYGRTGATRGRDVTGGAGGIDKSF